VNNGTFDHVILKKHISLPNNHVGDLFILQMRSVLFIPVLLLMLLTGIRIDITTHYCSGHVAARAISFEGKTASCGMEAKPTNNLYSATFSKHCCYDVMTSCMLGSKYFPTLFSSIQPDINQVNLTWFNYNSDTDYSAVLQQMERSDRPPGPNFPGSVSRPFICIFRI
jgi:hypothetical protein